MRNIKLTIQYDGTLFQGWQVQAAGKRTVQGEIEKTLSVIFKKHIPLIGSGRTDSGVHALAQVANFHIDSKMPDNELIRALNANLPDDILILNAIDVRKNFHAQYSIKRKTYRYTILNRPVRGCLERNFVYHYPGKLNVAAMRKAAGLLKGKKNFRSFVAADSALGGKDKNTIRSVHRIAIQNKDDRVLIEIEADGFLYKMVRNIVGTLLDVGRGKISAVQVGNILAVKDRRAAGTTAPAKGLCLIKAAY